ncbi:hypothetical protein NDU88_003229 [Pleurodeles waltl]|uniref:Uncharacterized protein n=1 Tax=Pleurodeles waltl TaxID=8319 RepID=A0AAV7V000_PLEWA|nr:hypothetical protein NDU88_003229 [Pleurodeles waltl]
MDGGSRPPGLHPQVSAQGGPLTWCLLPRPPGHRDPPPGPGPGPPRDSLRSFSLPRTPSAQLSAWPRPSRARRGHHLVFPSRDRPDLRAGIKCRISVFFFAVRDPRETQGHRGVRNGVFQLPWTALTMGG